MGAIDGIFLGQDLQDETDTFLPQTMPAQISELKKIP